MSHLQAVVRSNATPGSFETWSLAGLTHSVQAFPAVKWLMRYAKERRDYGQISALGDSQLRDIGLNRHDVLAAAAEWHPMSMLGRRFDESRH